MKLNKKENRMYGIKKMLICVLTVAMLIVLSLPAFAANGADPADEQKSNAAEQALDAGQENREHGMETEVQDSGEANVEGERADNTGKDTDTGAITESSDGKTTEDIQTEEKPDEETEPVLKDAASALPENNTKVSYTSAGSHPVKFTVNYDGYTFRGTCATLGVNNAKSGKATVKTISNDSKIAKLVYYYGYEKGWWLGANSSKKATTVLGFTDKNCTENAKQCIEALIQRDNMGWDKFWAARKVGGYRMYSTDSFMRQINNLYKNTDVSSITIPDDVEFEMFHGVTASSKQQDFYAWRYKAVPTTTNGFVAVEKVSADVSITD